MAQIALPYAFQNGPYTIDATQVMADLQAILTQVNGGLDDSNLKSTIAALAKVSGGILQILGAASGIAGINDAQIAAVQQLVWGTDAAIYRIAAGVLGLKATGGSLGPIVTVPGGTTAIKIQWGSVNVTTASAGVQASAAVTFTNAFVGAPIVLLSVNSLSFGGAGYITPLPSSVTATGFSAGVTTFQPQTVGLTWFALGT